MWHPEGFNRVMTVRVWVMEDSDAECGEILFEDM